jgi:hypothetical protein
MIFFLIQEHICIYAQVYTHTHIYVFQYEQALDLMENLKRYFVVLSHCYQIHFPLREKPFLVH